MDARRQTYVQRQGHSIMLQLPQDIQEKVLNMLLRSTRPHDLLDSMPFYLEWGSPPVASRCCTADNDYYKAVRLSTSEVVYHLAYKLM